MNYLPPEVHKSINKYNMTPVHFLKVQNVLLNVSWIKSIRYYNTNDQEFFYITIANTTKGSYDTDYRIDQTDPTYNKVKALYDSY
jgi:hypothetical protein